VLHKAWYHHCLPHFFTRGIIIWGEPIHVAKGASQADLEAARLNLENQLNALTLEADQAVAGEIVLPDEALRPGTGKIHEDTADSPGASA